MKRSRPKTWSQIVHPCKLALFAVVSVADLLMTWQLIQATNGQVYETNPLANAWLCSFGWGGLAVFKGLAVFLVMLSAICVSLYRPKVGSRILVFASSVTGAVVLYSCYLCHRDVAARAIADQDTELAEQKGRLLDMQMQRQKDYQALLYRLTNDLVSCQRTLPEAVHTLANSEKGQNEVWLTKLRLAYPGRSDAECMALHIGQHALVNVNHDVPLMKHMASRLEDEFREAFGSEVRFDLPEPHDAQRPAPSPRIAESTVPLVSRR
jgi:hypothetical protein